MSLGNYTPPVGFHFSVITLDPLDVAAAAAAMAGLDIDGNFQEVSGISVSINTEEIIMGGENRYVYQVPSQTKYDNLVLKRGLVTTISPLATWCQSVFESDRGKAVKTKHIMLNLLDESGLPLMCWTFLNAYPIRWEMSGFDAMQNQIVVEQVEFVYRRFERVSLDVPFV